MWNGQCYLLLLKSMNTRFFYYILLQYQYTYYTRQYIKYQIKKYFHITCSLCYRPYICYSICIFHNTARNHRTRNHLTTGNHPIRFAEPLASGISRRSLLAPPPPPVSLEPSLWQRLLYMHYLNGKHNFHSKIKTKITLTREIRK